MLIDPVEQQLETVTEVVPGVFLANNNVAQNMNFFQQNDIKAVLNCSRDLPFYRDNIHQMRISINDTPEANNEFYNALTPAIEFISAHKPILVHCFAGMSRSPSVIVAYLIKYHDMNPQRAVELILLKRPFAFNWGKMFYFADAINKYWSVYQQENAPKLSQ